MKTGIKQISEITGFSVATISNALNKKKGVNLNTSEAIFKVAREIGYLDQRELTKIKLVIYKKNGLIIDDSPFFNLLISGIEAECSNSGYELTIANVDSRELNWSEKAKGILNESGCAMIILGTELSQEDLKLIKEVNSPLLLLDYWGFDMDFSGVMINNDDSARMAVKYLVQKGHREIGYLKGSFRILGFEQRQAGYRAALSEFGIAVKSQYTVELSTVMNGAYQDMLVYLEGKPILPTAFFADNDVIALGAMKALLEKGYRIPEDVSIIGFDDLMFCEISTPRLTSIRVPKQEMGRLAVRRMIEIIKNEGEIKSRIQVCTEFIERDSVKTLV